MRKLFNYETRRQALASPRVFLHRLARNTLWSLAVVALSLLLGSAGYMWFENMRAIDAFANAAMILSGMGPLTALATDGGKIFAALYAIASGFLLFAVAGLILAPVYHRILHRFHVDEIEDREEAAPRRSRRRSS